MIKIDEHKVNILSKAIKITGSFLALIIPALFTLSTAKVNRFIGIATSDWIILGKWLLGFLTFLLFLLTIWLFITLWTNFKNNVDLQKENEKIKSKVNNLEKDYVEIKSNRDGLRQEVKAKKKEIAELRNSNEFSSVQYELLINQQNTIIASQSEVIKNFRNMSQTAKKIN